MFSKPSKVLVAALISTSVATNSTMAAMVSNEGGTILASAGDGFQPIRSSIELPPGGRVMVKSGGLATITYSSNCTVRVGSGVWLVQDKAPCREGATVIDFTGRMSDGIRDNSVKDEPAPPPPSYHHDLWIIGGLVAGGIVACVVWWCRNDKDKPASP